MSRVADSTADTHTVLATCAMRFMLDDHSHMYLQSSLNMEGISLSQMAAGVGVLLGQLHRQAGLPVDRATIAQVLAQVEEEYHRVAAGLVPNPLTGTSTPQGQA